MARLDAAFGRAWPRGGGDPHRKAGSRSGTEQCSRLGSIGVFVLLAGLDELAEQAWGRVVTLNPTPQSHWMHARMLLYSGKAKDAEEEMRSVVAANPDQFKALAYLGMMLYYEGKVAHYH